MYFRRLAGEANERVNTNEESGIFSSLLRAAALVLWLFILLYLFLPSSISWAKVPFPSVVRWIACGVAVFSSILMAWTLSSLGKNLTSTALTKSDSYLITSGPYSWVRHPYYSSTAIVMAAVFVLTSNWLVGSSSLLVLALLIMRTPKEEQQLAEKFGEAYRDYKTRTGMFVPLIASFRSSFSKKR